jgi:hypothetical protein
MSARWTLLYVLEMLAVLGANAWVIVATHRRLARAPFGPGWRACFFALACAGLGLGLWFLSVRYLVSPTSRVYGVPFCVAGGDFLQGRWSDGGVGRFLPLAFLADVSCGLSVCLLPLALASSMRRRFTTAAR